MKNRYPDLANIRRILVAKLRHHGDVLMTSPVFSVLKEALPDAKIDAYLYKETHPMLEGHPAISHFLLYDRKWKSYSLLKRLSHEWKLLRQIRKKRYDLVVNLTEGDRGAIAAYVSKAGLRIGFDPENSGMRGKNKCYTHIVKNCHRPRHSVERNLDALRCLGIFPKEEQKNLFLDVPKESQQKLTEILGSFGWQEKNFIVVHPVSRWLFKCLPTKTVADAIKGLQSKGKSIVLTGSSSPEEMQMNQEICELLPKNSSLLNLSGKISLKEFGALLLRSEALVTVDSVPLHMASALKTPVVALFGPTSEETWAPWQHEKSRVIAPKISCRPCYMPGCGGSYRSDCLNKITAGQIVQAVSSLTSYTT
ncbi:MAG: putative lipopolysaccharide heptosyltransferase III [Simkaniaceae bacterium]